MNLNSISIQSISSIAFDGNTAIHTRNKNTEDFKKANCNYLVIKLLKLFLLVSILSKVLHTQFILL